MQRAAKSVGHTVHRPCYTMINGKPAFLRLYRRGARSYLMVFPYMSAVRQHQQFLFAPVNKVRRIRYPYTMPADVRALETAVFSFYLLREEHGVAVIYRCRHRDLLELLKVLGLREAYPHPVPRVTAVEDIIDIPEFRYPRVLDPLALVHRERTCRSRDHNRFWPYGEIITVIALRETEYAVTV